jgi:TonB family protein
MRPRSPAGASSLSRGSGPCGEYRSSASLLAVVRRYAAGIQFCYDNQLKKQPGLRGKLVVSLTVLANGSVSEAIVVQDDLGSTAVTQCVLSQIRAWRFPEIPQGVVSFKTPFVFTPPE